jgi:SPP1 gp7 family putative phage head morphogenesis protein
MPLNLLSEIDFTAMPAEEAAKHFAAKAAVTDEQFRRLSVQAQQRAFTIAKVHKARVIQRARDVVHKAIREGTEYRKVREALLAIFEEEDLPRPALNHLRLVVTQNTQQAYNDARRDVLESVTDTFPYWQYLTVGDSHVRPTHAALDQLVFRADDPFWNSHYPPWEFGCRCTVRAMLAAEVQRKGIEVRNLGYVRAELGVGANRKFDRGKPNLEGIDEEIRGVLESEIGR